MKVEVAVLLAAAAILLVIGLFGQVMTEVESVEPNPPNGTIETVIRPYLPAGMISIVLGLIILLVAAMAALAKR
jgi:hypothetical protein